MGNLYLFLRRLAREVDQMMKPDMTSSTASSVVTMMDSDPLTAAMLTRTASNTLQGEPWSDQPLQRRSRTPAKI